MDMGYKWYAVKIGTICEFCYGAKGYCGLIKGQIKTCPGLMRNRPDFCPLIELKDEPKVEPRKDAKYRDF